MLSDSKKILDVVTKASETTEKRLMIYISTDQEAHQRKEISYIGFVLCMKNINDR